MYSVLLLCYGRVLVFVVLPFDNRDGVVSNGIVAVGVVVACLLCYTSIVVVVVVVYVGSGNSTWSLSVLFVCVVLLFVDIMVLMVSLVLVLLLFILWVCRW